MAFETSASPPGQAYTSYPSTHASIHPLDTWDAPLNGGPAGILSRIGAAVLDYIFWFPVEVFALYLLKDALGLKPGDLFRIINGTGYRDGQFVTVLCVQLSYGVYLSIADGYGGSLGKRLMRLRVINARTGGHLGIPRALFRQVIARTVSAWFCLLGYVCAFFTNEKKTFHDIVSGAQIVRARETKMVSVVSPDVVVRHR